MDNTSALSSDLRNTFERTIKHFARGKSIIAVCGEFCQGKSSLINALIDEQDLLPVDVDITTELISAITYGRVTSTIK